ncbi:MAG: pyridoxamine 5'-phosphate oxidase [Arcobacter sp.]|nr:pyridoxamine 5'-phosphate oxidase [Arcobacter sp.]
MDITQMRKQYIEEGLNEEDLESNPYKQFELWFNQAIDAGIREPNAMVLATTGLDMMPSVRTVLLKIFDETGFIFFSNYKSKKASDIEENPKVGALFPWLDLDRQVKIEGDIEKISSNSSLKYFLSRPKGSQIGAWVSHQSQVISSRSILEAKFNEIKNKFVKGEIPFPSFWGGYIIKPKKIEFWQAGENRLHDRFVYTLQENNSWKIQRLAP